MSMSIKEFIDTEIRVVKDPTGLCMDSRCKDTNWGGNDRLHTRDSDCPDFATWVPVSQKAKDAKKSLVSALEINPNPEPELPLLPNSVVEITFTGRLSSQGVEDGYYSIDANRVLFISPETMTKIGAKIRVVRNPSALELAKEHFQLNPLSSKEDMRHINALIEAVKGVQ